MSLSQYPRRKPGTAFREVDDGGLVVLSDKREVKVLNPVGTLVFSLLDGKHSQSEIAAAIVAEFEVTPEEAHRDMVRFLTDLEQHGMLDTAEGVVQ
jgi:hypothetical protein